MDRFSLAGKRALVTGASSGLGTHFAKVLAGAGADLILAARRRDRLEALAAEIARQGRRADVVVMDVTETASVEAAFAGIAASGAPADIVMNNSGLSREDWIAGMDEADWDLVMETNLKGAWRVAKAAAGALIAADKPGSIINTASITAHRPSQLIGAYAASKAAVLHLTRVMALEWARHGIRVNSLSPGYFETEINNQYLGTEAAEKMVRRIPMRRLGLVDELAGPVLLLASDAGSYITGADLAVDGGHLQSAL